MNIVSRLGLYVRKNDPSYFSDQEISFFTLRKSMFFLKFIPYNEYL